VLDASIQDRTVLNRLWAESGANLVGCGIESLGRFIGFMRKQRGLSLAGLMQTTDTDAHQSQGLLESRQTIIQQQRSGLPQVIGPAGGRG